ncbi:MAG TPA: hypothetical protein VJV79_23170 [Polyangiaceae bacterium]|nr:hypothetical protein [Polyangiaceae bacterium]
MTKILIVVVHERIKAYRGNLFVRVQGLAQRCALRSVLPGQGTERVGSIMDASGALARSSSYLDSAERSARLPDGSGEARRREPSSF